MRSFAFIVLLILIAVISYTYLSAPLFTKEGTKFQVSKNLTTEEETKEKDRFLYLPDLKFFNEVVQKWKENFRKLHYN
jgi:hypothetical protein